MLWSIEHWMIITLLLGQIAQCILSSRCTKIQSPCCSIERDVLPAQELQQVQQTVKPSNLNQL